MAKIAIEGGKVHMGGVRAKASRGVHLGDTVLMTRDFFDLEVTVLALATDRGNATIARTLYEETPSSVSARIRAVAARRLARLGLTPPATKPEKHDRRELRRLKQTDGEDQ